MPVHEYVCKTGHLTEKLELSHKNVKKAITCDKCGRKATKIVSHGSFILRGTGWERDGYKGKNG